jgi:small conductance mechanosensitive channel
VIRSLQIPPVLAAAARPTPLHALHAETSAVLSGDPSAWQGLFDQLGRFAVNLALALLILLVTLSASRWAASAGRRAAARLHKRYSADETLPLFVGSLLRWTVLVLGLVAVLQQLGVQTTSILAMLGAASLAIGLALQGALSNVAAGVMLLILRPYRIGDFVEVNGRKGTVKGLDLFGTQLSDPDNLVVFMPNSKVFGEMIVNYSAPGYRRMELNFRVDYADDLDKALAALKACLEADPRILKTPAPWTGLTELAESAVVVTLRAWAANDDYWNARYAMLRAVKQAFDAAGLAVPYPHQVSVTKPDAAPRPSREPSQHPSQG